MITPVTPQPVELLAEDPENAREITPAALAGLGVAMAEFGDLSGIVWNETTGQLVCGHQRMQSLRDAGAKTWQRGGSERAWIDHPKTSERFPIRIVAWDAERQRIANLVANNQAIAGQFTAEALAQVTALEDEANFKALGLDKLQNELGRKFDDDGDDDPADPLEEFNATPPPRPTWLMIAAPEDIAAEMENLLRAKFGNEASVRIERSSNAQ